MFYRGDILPVYALLGMILIPFYRIRSNFFFMQLGPEPDLHTWWAMAGLTALYLSNPGMTGMILAGFVLIYQRTGGEKLLSRFAPYGRMALINYILQTLLGTLFFYGWGLDTSGPLQIATSY